MANEFRFYTSCLIWGKKNCRKPRRNFKIKRYDGSDDYYEIITIIYFGMLLAVILWTSVAPLTGSYRLKRTGSTKASPISNCIHEE